ncbi:hypothetical protein SAMN06265378_1093 [Paracoccus sediminis]|uniref:Uncharacterized protein n=1 Tax=Paracoccus sediminis TaxID=1214787 RepID=A0A238XB01_9RHOB|nr:hypothetical protein SAMN06265378_1093 [Paracoccus sediminis]
MRARPARVYPRGCGGAGNNGKGHPRERGLSPRVRGSLREVGDSTDLTGSIPAGAGEPAWRRCCATRRRVYPRGCGGAGRDGPQAGNRPGLSPRVRGSHFRATIKRVRNGSIPAGAGEPSRGGRQHRPDRVYPRGCGGA